AYGRPPQCVLTLPILVGIDGVNRMSKSLGNYIGIDELPREIFGKVMSISDNLIYSYWELLTDVDDARLAEIKAKLDSTEYNPMDIKKDLAVTLVGMYHNREAGLEAREEFERIFSDKGLPDEIQEFSISTLGKKIWVVKLLTETGTVKSGGEARRLIKGGGLYVNNERITDESLELDLSEGMLFKAGKRRFFKIVG
ncbi:MAG: tyrosine--tRNA ligase, partial [candidate division Zixibacteria bacterium]|nr:tyrosine--tRNA ligase [candidate division Zixibacteria bacterium]